jgi:catechol 2,3-dioxygenase-like lactoylglutathione lyase family enzyme
VITGLHHVQLAIPEGAEEEARDFYGRILGLQEVDKPADLQSRGGCWFRSSGVEVHLGVDPEFRPAAKAHPAFIVDSLDQLGERLGDAGYLIDIDTQLSGFKRFHSADPFGNRLEFLQQSADS